ncbi:TolC family protein [Nitrincola sp. A-D6]|uniref:TolC family protein n=1 Tax=Nitrincola sp. A-D6 TaxID=1545442 RepID=UPI00068F6803|nr:TolC family protein [Nitrincola sp. A-D6]
MKIIKAPRTLLACLISGSCLLSVSAYAQMDSTTVADIARKAIETNPEVQANWHAFMASGHDTEFASGGYRPVVDFTAGYGHEYRDWENYTGKDEFSGAAAEITLTQMLYDGFRTRNEVQRFESAQLVRYFELLDSVENTALGAVNAYEDVMRYRELVALAEENYEEHITVFDRIEESAQAGVARRADLEQISGRLSLAEANLLTEMSNLHDVSARYLRIVGELPADNLLPANLNDSGIPADVREALQLAYQATRLFTQQSVIFIHRKRLLNVTALNSVHA